jgi:A/G-specific adenine glycosylase
MKYLDGISKKRIRTFRERAVKYYHDEGRKELPWRQTNDPWEILLAEILLRKTTARQAESIYEEVSRLSPEELRDFPIEKLESLLKPLGIHKERTRLLKLVGQQVSEAGMEALSEWNFLISLPGVGRYAASMVLSTAFGEPKPGMDRNMIRVLERVFSIESEKARPHTDRELWEAAEVLMPEENASAYNWGILDIAAAVCKPRDPICAECPLTDICDFVKENRLDLIDESERQV